MAEVFTNVKIYPYLTGGTVVEWSIHPQFTDEGDWAFTVQWSRSGVAAADDWLTAGSTTGQLGSTLFNLPDATQRIWAYADRLFYRVRLVTTHGTYYSAATPVWGILQRRERILAAEILRKELLLHRRYTGACGKLMKRRNWGVRCTNEGCVDYDTTENRNEKCPVCYNTGFLGGYFPGTDFWTTKQPAESETIDNNPQSGTSEGPLTDVFRTIACPDPRPNDFWWESQTDARWLILKREVVADVRGVPLVLNLTMRKLEPTDIIQNVPV